jgi:hypothetical protein
VANSYDLLLQPLTQGAPIDVPAVEASLLGVGALKRPDGSFSLRLSPSSRADLELHWVRENGEAKALDCRIPLSDQTDLIDSALRWALVLAPAHQLCVMDPQLNTVVTTAGGSVLDEFLRSARYAGEYTGVSDAVGASALAEVEQGSSAGTRVLLAIAVFIAVLYATFSVLTRGPPQSSAPAQSHGPLKQNR